MVLFRPGSDTTGLLPMFEAALAGEIKLWSKYESQCPAVVAEGTYFCFPPFFLSTETWV